MAVTAQDRNINKAQVNDFIEVLVNKMSDSAVEKNLKLKYEEVKSLAKEDKKEVPNFSRMQKIVLRNHIRKLDKKIVKILGTQIASLVTRPPEEINNIAKTMLNEIYEGSLEGTLCTEELVKENNRKIEQFFPNVDAKNPYIIEDSDKEDALKRIFLPQPDFENDIEKEESSQYVEEDNIDLYMKTLFSANRLTKVIDDITNSLIGVNAQTYNKVYKRHEKRASNSIVSLLEDYKLGKVTESQVQNNSCIKMLRDDFNKLNPNKTNFNLADYEFLVNSKSLQQNLYNLKHFYLDKVIEEVGKLESKSTEEPQAMVKMSSDGTENGNVVNIAKQGCKHC